MAIISRGILGGFKGKVANVVGTSWKGRAVMKSLPLSVANPRSAGQVTQRTKFSNVTQIASSFLNSWIKPLWNPFAGNISGYNKFTSVNVPLANVDLNLTIEATKFTSGGVDALTDSEFVTDLDNYNPTMQFTWTTDTNGNKLATDKIYAFCMSKITGEVFGAGYINNRSNGNGLLALSRIISLADTPFVGICALRSDSSDVSNTTTRTLVA